MGGGDCFDEPTSSIERARMPRPMLPYWFHQGRSKADRAT